MKTNIKTARELIINKYFNSFKNCDKLLGRASAETYKAALRRAYKLNFNRNGGRKIGHNIGYIPAEGYEVVYTYNEGMNIFLHAYNFNSKERKALKRAMLHK